ncbi:homoserine O-acetyltransferase MetX [Vulcanococcus limneticus]|uniref:homoserine O-acetyltransferase MetX n=1 Tax=Vulcanococcus limneticus TaxID=2170428 RepID=UPI00398BC60C
MSGGGRRATGAWLPGDPPGRRQFAQLFTDRPLQLDLGGQLGPITLAYESWGQLNSQRSNGVLLLHGFSGDSHAAGPAEAGHPSPGWWDAMVGPGRPVDTQRFFVVCPNALGGCQGSTGPSAAAPDGRPYGSRLPALTIRDLVAAELALADQLGIARWHGVIGGSMGGMRALEWAVTAPQRVANLLLMATAAATGADQIAQHQAQIEAIRLDPLFNGGDYDANATPPLRGLLLARGLATLGYCNREALEQQFGRQQEPAGCFAINTYLRQEGEALARRFDANSYIALSQAMNHHDIGRERGGMAAALERITARTSVVSIRSDRLFPPEQQRQISRGLRSLIAHHNLDSIDGHDGFLTEVEQLEPIVRELLG